MMRLIARNVRLRKAAIAGGLVLAMSGLTACGESDSEIGWKLKNQESRTYSIKILGTARMEPDLFNYDRASLLVNGAPVNVSLQDETFLIVKNKGGSALEGEYITGPFSYAAYPDTSNNPLAEQTLQDIFEKEPAVSLGKFEIEEKGAYNMPTVNPFLAMKIYLRLPEEEILETKQAPLPRLGYTNESLCLSLHNRKVKTQELDSKITLNKLSKNSQGELIADMRYLVTEKIETEYQEGDFARRQFIKRFNDWNLLGQRPLLEDEDDIQKVYICKYKGRHIFNVTRGWLESATGEQAIEVIKYLDEGTKVVEILRAKIKIAPTDQRVKAMGTYNEFDVMSEAEPQSKNKAPVKAAAKNQAAAATKIEPAAGNETAAPALPTSVPAGDSLPDPDIDIDELLIESR